MKLVIAGSRIFNIGYERLIDAFNMFWPNLTMSNVSEIVSGGCPTGVDADAKELALLSYDAIKYKEFPAQWEKYGKAAGPFRNQHMAEYGDALLLIWDGESRGSKNMKEEMLKLDKPVFEVILKKYNT